MRAICFLAALIASMLTGKFLIADDPFFNWGYFAIMIAAADQIRTKIVIGGRYEQTITMSPIAAIWAVLYLQPLQAFYACAVAYLFAAVVMEWKRYKPIQRITNYLSMTAASGCMVVVYTLLTNMWGAVWPSFIAAVAAIAGMFFYDLVNVLTLALPFHYAEKLSWREIYHGWADYAYYPVFTAVTGITMAIFVTAFQWGLPLIAVALVMFLKPQYDLPSISRIRA